jgi:16S rRNA G966 N2-methylase RsmD
VNPEQLQILRKLQSITISDISTFALKNPLKLTSTQLIWTANQLHFREKIIKKIPSWSKVKLLVSPATLSIEQSSSEVTAKYKADLFSGETCLDLTGGMGVDSHFFSQVFKNVTYVEQDAELVKVTEHNFNQLGANNIELVNKTAEDFLAKPNKHYDLVYLDPARRDEHGGKVFFIQDCSPNVIDLLPELLKVSNNILIKYAPMLDIKAALKSLIHVQKVIIVAVENDVKEALYLIKKETGLPKIETVNFSKNGKQQFASSFDHETEITVAFSEPKTYLYEPNAAILKAGLFKSLAEKYLLSKIATNSHLYSSDTFHADFPGRKFSVGKTEKFDKKSLRRQLKGNYANVSCRNFPLKPDALKKLLSYKDGGDQYIFFTQNESGKKIVIFTSKTGDE